MSIKVTVNPNAPDPADIIVLEHDRQVVLDAEFEWSDGHKTTMSVYIHGTVLNPETGETSKTVTWEMPPATKVSQEQAIDLDQEGHTFQ